MSLEACRDLVARADPERFRAIRGLPEAVLAKLLPILALNVEVSRAPWVTQEPMIAEMRLQWWRDALEEIAKGGVVRKHEVTVPLAFAITPDVAQKLDAYVAARRWDIYSDPFENAAHQEEYLRKTGGLLMWAMAVSLGDTQGEAALRFGMGVGAAGLLRAVPELEARGRKPLISQDDAGGETLAQQGLVWMDQARQVRGDIQPDVVPALLTGWWARPVLRATPEMSEFQKRARLAKLGLFGWWR